jgi:hypothetical protein
MANIGMLNGGWFRGAVTYGFVAQLPHAKRVFAYHSLSGLAVEGISMWKLSSSGITGNFLLRFQTGGPIHLMQ